MPSQFFKASNDTETPRDNVCVVMLDPRFKTQIDLSAHRETVITCLGGQCLTEELKLIRRQKDLKPFSQPKTSLTRARELIKPSSFNRSSEGDVTKISIDEWTVGQRPYGHQTDSTSNEKDNSHPAEMIKKCTGSTENKTSSLMDLMCLQRGGITRPKIDSMLAYLLKQPNELIATQRCPVPLVYITVHRQSSLCKKDMVVHYYGKKEDVELVFMFFSTYPKLLPKSVVKFCCFFEENSKIIQHGQPLAGTGIVTENWNKLTKLTIRREVTKTAEILEYDELPYSKERILQAMLTKLGDDANSWLHELFPWHNMPPSFDHNSFWPPEIISTFMICRETHPYINYLHEVHVKYMAEWSAHNLTLLGRIFYYALPFYLPSNRRMRQLNDIKATNDEIKADTLLTEQDKDRLRLGCLVKLHDELTEIFTLTDGTLQQIIQSILSRERCYDRSLRIHTLSGDMFWQDLLTWQNRSSQEKNTDPSAQPVCCAN